VAKGILLAKSGFIWFELVSAWFGCGFIWFGCGFCSCFLDYARVFWILLVFVWFLLFVCGFCCFFVVSSVFLWFHLGGFGFIWAVWDFVFGLLNVMNHVCDFPCEGSTRHVRRQGIHASRPRRRTESF